MCCESNCQKQGVDQQVYLLTMQQDFFDTELVFCNTSLPVNTTISCRNLILIDFLVLSSEKNSWNKKSKDFSVLEDSSFEIK